MPSLPPRLLIPLGAAQFDTHPANAAPLFVGRSSAPAALLLSLVLSVITDLQRSDRQQQQTQPVCLQELVCLCVVALLLLVSLFLACAGVPLHFTSISHPVIAAAASVLILLAAARLAAASCSSSLSSSACYFF